MYYKHIGETTTQFVDRLCISYGKNKACVCGKLDPMSRGLTKVLFDEHTKQMNKHLKSVKTYEFYIVLGVSTTSDDIMGHIEKEQIISQNDIKKVKAFINNYNERKVQKYHPISAIQIRKNGVRKPLWHWHKHNNLTHDELPSKDAHVYSTDLFFQGRVAFNMYLENVISRLETVIEPEVFDINTLTDKWNKIERDDVFMLHYEMTVSSGFYIRMLAYDIKRELGIPVHIYDIHRTNVQYF